MSILTELNSLLNGLQIPVETGVFSEKAPDEYIVITPMADVFELHADNRPQAETQEARLSLFSKGNYIARKNQIVHALLDADFTITARLYVGHEDDTGYHHVAIDIALPYELED
jgi:hypothetical protein